MSLQTLRTSMLTGMLTSPTTMRLQRSAVELTRRTLRRPHTVTLYHQVDDPYSHLLIQRLDAWRARHPGVKLIPRLVGPPPDDAAPDRARLVAYGRRDAEAIAPHYGVTFKDPGHPAHPTLADLAQRLLTPTLQNPDAFLALAPKLGEALWRGDAETMDAIARQHRVASNEERAQALKTGEDERRQRGHYLGATLHYGGEWYWGLDRLHFLGRRLAELGLWQGEAPWTPLVAPGQVSQKVAPRPRPDIVLEVFCSLRSPYSYLAIDRVRALAARRRITLRLRPVLPMVMRGLQVPLTKRLYIVQDSAREARRHAIPFGRIADPVGQGVERGLALFPMAEARDLGGALLSALGRAVMADGQDLCDDRVLKRLVTRIGLSWDDAQAALNDDAWRALVGDNREALLNHGLWGVPSFHIGEESVWGQDRLWLVEREIERLQQSPPT